MEETENLGFARLDHDRSRRKGGVETIFCQGKTCEQVAAIFERFAAHDGCALGTRASKEQYEAVLKRIPAASYNELGRVIYLNREKVTKKGAVAIVTGGTADLPRRRRSRPYRRIFWRRSAPLHRCWRSRTSPSFIGHRPDPECSVAVVIAGMEGALPSVVAGLIDKPVIAVPTSVGYGASFQGLTPCSAMLNSCAEGITVVNIDNGFGAGYSAAQINRLTTPTKNRRKKNENSLL